MVPLDGRKQLVGIFLTTFGKQVNNADKRQWFDAQKQTVASLIKELPRYHKDASYSIGTYGNWAQVRTPFYPGLSGDELKNAIDNIRDPQGTSNVYQALLEADENMFSNVNKDLNSSDKVLVLFIEEGVAAKEKRMIEKAKALREKGVKIIAVVAGPKVSDENMDDLIGSDGKVIFMRQPDKQPAVAPIVPGLKTEGNIFWRKLPTSLHSHLIFICS